MPVTVGDCRRSSTSGRSKICNGGVWVVWQTGTLWEILGRSGWRTPPPLPEILFVRPSNRQRSSSMIDECGRSSTFGDDRGRSSKIANDRGRSWTIFDDRLSLIGQTIKQMRCLISGQSSKPLPHWNQAKHWTVRLFSFRFSFCFVSPRSSLLYLAISK